MSRILRVAVTAIATAASAVALNLPGTAATAAPVYNWTGASDFDESDSYFWDTVDVMSGLKIVTSGYAHSHSSDTITVTIRALPSYTTLWTMVVPSGGQVPMAVDAVFPPVANVTGINITSWPYQSQTFHGFSPSDTIAVVGSTDVIPTVPPQCNDGLDNDLNGYTDYPYDPGCSWYDDNTEASAPTPGACSTVGGVPACIKNTPNGIFRTVSITSAETYTAGQHSLFGSVDIYRFALPTGGSATLPCVVTVVNGSSNDPCKSAGGTFVSRIATLVNRSVDQPGVRPAGTLVTVNVCHSLVTTTVAGIGIENFPAYTIC